MPARARTQQTLLSTNDGDRIPRHGQDALDKKPTSRCAASGTSCSDQSSLTTSESRGSRALTPRWEAAAATEVDGA
eukprot:symbB.v1.2.002614.t1/scaffold135.1/size305288/34